MDFLAEQGEDRIDFLNLDCEGSELLVLQGARSCLEEHGPEIFCELHRGYLAALDQSVDHVVDLLRELGYEIRPVRVEDLTAETTVEECSHIYARKTSQDRAIGELKRKIADLEGRMPAHSVRPSMMQELEELEERLRMRQKEPRENKDS
jgi:hypothetical protein